MVPEPSTLALFAGGVGAALSLAARKSADGLTLNTLEALKPRFGGVFLALRMSLIDRHLALR
jgi:hypothetical protein